MSRMRRYASRGRIRIFAIVASIRYHKQYIIEFDEVGNIHAVIAAPTWSASREPAELEDVGGVVSAGSIKFELGAADVTTIGDAAIVCIDSHQEAASRYPCPPRPAQAYLSPPDPKNKGVFAVSIDVAIQNTTEIGWRSRGESNP